MKTIRWNADKAELLKTQRDIDLNKIALLIEEHELLATMINPNRSGQSMFVLDYDDYVVCVPFVESDREIFLKTAYRNRKLNKKMRLPNEEK